jgi:hypothetical protein
MEQDTLGNFSASALCILAAEANSTKELFAKELFSVVTAASIEAERMTKAEQDHAARLIEYLSSLKIAHQFLNQF